MVNRTPGVSAPPAPPKPVALMSDNESPRSILLASYRQGRIYVAGPMTGLPDLNFPAFNAAAAALRAVGWHVENPADHGEVEGAEWSDYLLHDMRKLGTCSAIFMLPGWSRSKGARLEMHVARETGLSILFAAGAETREPEPAVLRASRVEVENMGDHFRKLHLQPGASERVTLHHFTAPDSGDPHDHPYDFTTLVLSGGYVEEVWEPVLPDGWGGSVEWNKKLFFRAPGTSHRVASAAVHRIVSLPAGECVTAVVWHDAGVERREVRYWKPWAFPVVSRQHDEDHWRVEAAPTVFQGSGK